MLSITIGPGQLGNFLDLSMAGLALKLLLLSFSTICLCIIEPVNATVGDTGIKVKKKETAKLNIRLCKFNLQKNKYFVLRMSYYRLDFVGLFFFQPKASKCLICPANIISYQKIKNLDYCLRRLLDLLLQ